MADSTLTATPFNDIEYSIFQRTVTLYDWWLIKVKNDSQEKRLAVGGVSSRKDEAMRVFVSAPIIKRFDEFYLETVDGKCVVLSGFINKQRTIENGFDPQIFKRFLFGFPPDWENSALYFSREESTSGTDLDSAFIDDVPTSCPEILSDGAEDCNRSSLVSPEEAPGDNEKSFLGYDCNVSKGIGGVNLKAEGCYIKKVGRPKGARNKSASAGKNSRQSKLSPKTEGCYKKKVSRPKEAPSKSASAVKNSSALPGPSNFRTSRSGRLLLPPLEFWRNQVPIYDADHELKEIKDGASLISPCRVSSPSLNRFNNPKRAA